MSNISLSSNIPSISNTYTIKKDDLSGIVEFLNRNLDYDKVTLEFIELKVYNDPNFDPELCLLEKNEKNEIISLMFGAVGEFKGNKVGWLKMFVTDKKYRRQGIAKKNLVELENRFRIRQVKEIQALGDVPGYFLPGIDPRYTEAVVFLSNHGYEKTTERVNMETDVSELELSTDVEDKNLKEHQIQVCRARKSDQEDVLNWLSGIFPTWKYEAKNAFSKDPCRMFIARNLNGNIAGFSCYCTTAPDWFGPIGVDKEYRKHGLGNILLKKCLSEMKQAGYHKIVIPWTDAYRFYLQSCNAYISRIFWVMNKKI